MAMDKERLLVWFQTHYFSRQEVLYKLPLNLSIESFWAELLNRRKAGATLLPLYNAAGMPYWYVLTDRMVAASERLCEEAFTQEEVFDPYRAHMTSAMTEEMFFTSFVEGAQIPLQEAMDFLQRGTEPENIQEQMIWNNRHAWAEMTATLYRPLDERFIKSLVYMLTEEMDGCAEDYRQADNHPIAAMNEEPYDLPPAFALPDRMREYCTYLAQPDVHPLVKSAVAQAYILVARSFPEGNERLSRMLSSAVLLRCGYDFFRDISLSAVIAKESYRYYKAMREILQPENGGDLTYFIEYYLELLVRAVEARRERLRRREQEALEREREMARQSLQPPDFVPVGEVMEAAEAVPEAMGGELHPDESDKLVTGTHFPMEEFMKQVNRLKHSSSKRVRQIPETVKSMLEADLQTFTIHHWADYSGLSNEESDQQCRLLFQRELQDRDKRGRVMKYTFRVILTDPEGRPGEKGSDAEPMTARTDTAPSMTEYLSARLKVLEGSRYESQRCAAQTIRRLIAQGIRTFRKTDWITLTGLTKDQAENTCEILVSMQIVRKISERREPCKYEINCDCGETEGPTSPEIVQRLNVMTENTSSARDKRIGDFLLSMIGNGKRTFSTQDWEDAFSQTSSVFGADIRRALNLGLIHRENGNIPGIKNLYTISDKLKPGLRADDLTYTQRSYLARLYDAYSTEEFTIEDAGKVLGHKGSSVNHHINSFRERGILEMHPHSGRAYTYSFVVAPDLNPECFSSLQQGSKPIAKVPMAAGRKRSAAIAV